MRLHSERRNQATGSSRSCRLVSPPVICAGVGAGAAASILLMLWVQSVAASFPPGPTFPQGSSKASDSQRPRVALVLSGGGARGFSHVGILKAFEEEGIAFDLIVGTSMGAIVGSLFACGYSPAEIQRLVHSVDWVRLLGGTVSGSELVSARYGEARGLVSLRFRRFEPQASPGLLPAQRVYELLFSLTAEAEVAYGGCYDSLMVPLRIVASDLKTGQPVVFAGGHLAKCILASMAIPFLFPPVPWGDSLLVDGGLLDNTPVDVARAWGAEIVVAVDVSSIGEREVRFDDMIDVFRRTMDIWMTRTNQLHRETPDLLLRPYLEQRSPLDYAAADTIVALGYRYAKAMMDSVRALIPVRTNWQERREGFRQRLWKKMDLQMEPARFAGLERTHPSALRGEMTIQSGSSFDVQRVVRDLRSLYATGLFDQVMVRFQRLEPRRVRVIYEVRERQAFDVTLGGSYFNREGESGFLQFRHLNLFGYGGKGLFSLRLGPERDFVASEFHTRRFLGHPLAIQAAAFWERNRPAWYRAGRPVGRRSFDVAGAQLSLGVAPRKERAVSLGLTGTRVVRASQPELSLTRSSWNTRSGTLLLCSDTVDNPLWPSSGNLRMLRLERWFHRWGGTMEGSQLTWRLRGYAQTGRTVLGYSAQGLMTSGRLPEEFWGRAGSPDLFPGLERGELWTPCFFSCVAEAQFVENPILRWCFGIGVGWSAERVGRLFSSEAFVGARAGVRLLTPVGPVMVDLAYGEGGRWAYYLSVGYPF